MTSHIAQIGTGTVGRPTAYTIMCAGLASTMTICDTKPGLAKAFAEELRHASASLRLDVEINACERDEDVAGADIILLSAGYPRSPGVKITRRDLVVQNAKIVRYIAEVTAARNPGAKYIVITNPVDAMAMVCKKYCKAEFVISTGTNLESLRLRSKLARTLGVPVSKVQGWVGGEHGSAAVILWSTVRIRGLPLEEYVRSLGEKLDKSKIGSYVKGISKLVVDNIGGTEFGPAASFRDIVRAIAKNTDEILPIATPMRFEGISEPVFVGFPVRLGGSIGPSLFNILSDEEKNRITKAAGAIYQTYQTAIEAIE